MNNFDENSIPLRKTRPRKPTASRRLCRQRSGAQVPLTADTAAPPAEPSGRSAAPRHQKSAGKALFDLVGGVVPHTGDSVLEIVRKCVFVVAPGGAHRVGVLSVQRHGGAASGQCQNHGFLSEATTPPRPPVLTDEEKNWDGYPEGMSEDFKKLYYMNNDTRGVLTYRTSGSKDLFDGYITNMPVVQTTDNEYYLTHDFQKTANKAGACTSITATTSPWAPGTRT